MVSIQRKYTKQPLKFSFVVTICFILFSALYSTFIYHKIKKETGNDSQKVFRKCVNGIEHAFINYKQVFNIIAKNVSQNTQNKNEKYLTDLIAYFSLSGSAVENNKLLNLGSLYWVDENEEIGTVGRWGRVIEKPELDSEYLRHLHEDPWSLQISEAKNFPIQEDSLIHLGMGVADPHGQFLGFVVLKLTFEDLLLNLGIKANNILNYRILNANNNIVFSSKNFNADLKSVYPLSYKMGNSPYTLIFGSKENEIFNRFKSTVMPVLAIIGLFYLLSIFLVWFYWKTIRETIKHDFEKIIFDLETQKRAMHEEFSQTLRLNQRLAKYLNALDATHTETEAFLKCIHQRTLLNIKFIIETLKKISKVMMSEGESSSKIKTHIKFIIQINKDSSTYQIRNHESEKTAIDVHKIIDESLKIHAREIYLKEINLETHLKEDTPQISIDAICLKQILVSSIANCLSSVPKGGRLSIEMYCDRSSLPHFLNIVLKDDGFGVDESQLSSFPVKSELQGNFIHKDLKTIKALVKSVSGRLEVKNELYKGKVIHIIIPYSLKSPASQSLQLNTQNSNVYPLAKKKL